jgi:hypothetical protein
MDCCWSDPQKLRDGLFLANIKKFCGLYQRSRDESLKEEERSIASKEVQALSLEQVKLCRIGSTWFKVHVLQVTKEEEIFLEETLKSQLTTRPVANFWHLLGYKHQIEAMHLVVFLQPEKTYTFVMILGYPFGEMAPSGEKWPLSFGIFVLMMLLGILPEHFWKLCNPGKLHFIEENPFVDSLSPSARYSEETTTLVKEQFEKMFEHLPK